MKKQIDCEVFGARLEAWVAGHLESEAAEAMRLHAGSCSTCAKQLAVQRHLAEASGVELEAAVPDEWVGSTWQRVSDALAGRSGSERGRSEGGRPPRWRSDWLVPSMAAAILALVMGSGFLLGEVLRLRDREAALAGALASHEARLADLEADRGLAGIGRSPGPFDLGALERQLARRGAMSIGELEETLAGLPPDITLLSPSQLEALRASTPFRGAVWSDLLGDMNTEDGIQAGELLELARELNLDPGTVLTPGRVRSLSRGLLDPGRS